MKEKKELIEEKKSQSRSVRTKKEKKRVFIEFQHVLKGQKKSTNQKENKY